MHCVSPWQLADGTVVLGGGVAGGRVHVHHLDQHAHEQLPTVE